MYEIKLIKNSLDFNKHQNVVDMGGGTVFITKSIVDIVKYCI
jgi:hypothetical protein